MKKIRFLLEVLIPAILSTAISIQHKLNGTEQLILYLIFSLIMHLVILKIKNSKKEIKN